MPDAVQTFVDTKQMDEVLRIQRDIVRSYEEDTFKVYMLDCDLFVSMLEDGIQYDILQGNLIYTFALIIVV